MADLPIPKIIALSAEVGTFPVKLDP